MPTGPNGEKRPQGDTACAVHVMKIATGEIQEKRPPRQTVKQAHRAREERAAYGEVLRAGSGKPHFTVD